MILKSFEFQCDFDFDFQITTSKLIWILILNHLYLGDLILILKSSTYDDFAHLWRLSCWNGWFHSQVQPCAVPWGICGRLSTSWSARPGTTSSSLPTVHVMSWWSGGTSPTSLLLSTSWSARPVEEHLQPQAQLVPHVEGDYVCKTSNHNKRLLIESAVINALPNFNQKPGVTAVNPLLTDFIFNSNPQILRSVSFTRQHP